MYKPDDTPTVGDQPVILRLTIDPLDAPIRRDA